MLRKLLFKSLTFLRSTFWIVPGAMVLAGAVAAIALVWLDRHGWSTRWISPEYLYDGGMTGARTLLGAVASSSIAVAGTLFSITIAALSLTAGQMGPRLLRNFTADRGSQLTLGAFLATFAYSLLVLRSVRSVEEGDFVPHLAMTVDLLMAGVCVGMLVYFIGHMAGRINVDTVVELVSQDLRSALDALCSEAARQEAVPESFWADAETVCDPRRGYVQHLDTAMLAQWAADRELVIRMLVRPGDYVFPHTPIALVRPRCEGADQAIRTATSLGTERTTAHDPAHAIRQLVEVAVRALSRGINDPNTAIGVLDRLGASLCEISQHELVQGTYRVAGHIHLVVPAIDYDGLADVMFHTIRQEAASSGSVSVLTRMIDVLAAVAFCEQRPPRIETLRRHAEAIAADARRTIANAADLQAFLDRLDEFHRASRIESRCR
ncbi:DUF2254 domain-containing protein [Variovorax defluvii]|uniref:DUF2254 domain-containing protein n=1 Tax=Variovorax defluvii TaxID=913761 RepID=A0ABP8I5T2_9BURK